MNKKEYIKQINYANNEIGQVYHQFSAYYGLSDSVSDILYILEQENGSCDQSLLYKLTMVSRKTVSSALNGMQAKGYIRILPKNGRENRVFLTDKGWEYLNRTEANITLSETEVYSEWNEKELSQYYELSQRFLEGLKNELKKLKETKRNDMHGSS